MTEPYRAPKGTVIFSDPIKKRIVASEPNGDVVYLGFDFENQTSAGVIPAVERERFSAHDIAVQQSKDRYSFQRASDETRKMMDLRSEKTQIIVN